MLGDAYGCGIVEHLSRAELKKLDDDVDEQEFTHTHRQSAHPKTNDTPTVDQFPNQNPSISIWNEADQQLSQSDRRHSAKSYNSNSGLPNEFPEQTVASNQQQQQQEHPTSPTSDSGAEQIPIVIMDAGKRNAAQRQIIFNKPKLPTSVNSMPHIALYSTNVSSSKNNNGVNQDSNV